MPVDLELETYIHMKDPQPGDRFHEMYSYYVHVVERNGDKVTIEEYFPPANIPTDAKIKTMTVKEFDQYYAYKSIPGYSIKYIDNDAPIEHYYKQFEQM